MAIVLKNLVDLNNIFFANKKKTKFQKDNNEFKDIKRTFRDKISLTKNLRPRHGYPIF